MSARRFRAAEPKEVFLSHSGLDRSFVSRLGAFLENKNIRYWYSASHIAAARQWHDEIGRALRRCDWFVVVLSTQSVKSKWVKRELLYALNHQRYNEKIIPLLRTRCHYNKLSWTLSEFQFVDFASDFDAGCRQLLRVWGLSHGKESTRRVSASRS